VTPLRQIDDRAVAADAHLFEPQEAWRWRWNTWTDTPLPPDEPAGQNPPDGAVISYHLKAAATGPVTLQILAAGGEVVRTYSSGDPPEQPIEGRNIPDYWIRPPQRLRTDAGLHRFVWDLHYPPPAVDTFSYPISAIGRDTWREPRGMWVMPGAYTVRLTVDGRAYERPLKVKMDPRVKTAAAGLLQQFNLSKQMYDGIAEAGRLLERMRVRRADTAVALKSAVGPEADRLKKLDAELAALEGAGGGRGGFGPPAAPGAPRSLSRLRAEMAAIYEVLQDADAAPTSQVRGAVAELLGDLGRLRAAGGR
jgi:hypothetical protein